MTKDNQSKKEILKENKKNIVKNIPLILLILYLLLPILYFISGLFNYRLVLFNNIVFSIIIVVISILLTYLSFLTVNKYNKFNREIIAILPFISIINIIFCAILMSKPFCTIVLFATLICSIVLVLKYVSYKWKVLSIAIAGILLFLSWFIILIASVFGDFGKTVVMNEAESPNGKLVAKIIDDDQGALGGSTLVQIYKKNKDIDLKVFKFEQIPVTIYEGKWGEFNSMTIDWKDNKTVLINGKEHSIKKKTINR